ncbi:MAG: hypothetical protein MCSN_0290 [Candidatus Microsyncoccus archaeolyticus]|nr:MAG: hypothetical protein MCSN_0290 [Candidatus Parcubacteria bacterium]
MNKSFTLIEILVVIVVVGILSTFILVGISSITNSANITKSKAFENSLRNSLLTSLISEWKLDGNANDSWSTNNGTITGHEPLIESENNCIDKNCFNFNGTSSTYVYIGNNPRPTGSQTISLWYKLNNYNPSVSLTIIGGISFSSGIDCGHAIGLTTDGRFFSDIYSGDPYGNHRSSAILYYPKDNKWHFIVSTYDTSANIHKLYLDNQMDPNTPNFLNYRIEWGTRTLNIGKGDNDRYFDGLVDEVIFYNDTISAFEVNQKYFIGLNKLYIKKNLAEIEYNKKLTGLQSNLIKQ